MILNFYARFSTSYGQSLYVSGSHALLGNDVLTSAIAMQYFNEEFWFAQIEIPAANFNVLDIEYRYLLRELDGNEIVDWGNDRIIDFKKNAAKEITLIDTWNHAGEIENAFFTKPFQEVLLTYNDTVKHKASKNYTHEFKVKAPLLKNTEVICITGSGKFWGDWDTVSPVLMAKENNWWVARVNLSTTNFPIVYKYGIYDTELKQFTQFENGGNRTLSSDSGKGKNTIIHDGFAHLPTPNWKGSGVAIPVFSIRTNDGFGTGEFNDIHQLVNWAKMCGIKLIQLLPINDTTATYTYLDSYPYAAISAFALHPIYLNINSIAGPKNKVINADWNKQQAALNELPTVDYEAIIKAKLAAIAIIFQQQKKLFKDDLDYIEFFEINRHWLVPYAVFCYLRDTYKTADYNQWKTNSIYNEAEILKLASPTTKHYDEIAIHYFIQYHLHVQLKKATAYAHKNGIVVKGDLPIGIYRYGCDAWMAPALYNMDAQAGAPPDDFAIKGQNWGFPTYNWNAMQQDGFAWWRQRFEQMSAYFDAFRIDHILGFFRIWSIPLHAVQGILGKFVPAIPININELHQNNISFDYYRYCKPFITDDILYQFFGEFATDVKEIFLFWNDGNYAFKEPFDTQRKIEAYFKNQSQNNHNHFLQNGLYDLHSNVIFIEEEGSQFQQYHCRINMESTASFMALDNHTKEKLKALYINYFFRRQDDFWKKQAMNKLPQLKRTTNMLVCGEDLGMVPDCVPDVMKQLGMLSLEIQRMPKDPKTEFFHPADAPYLSVVTPSTHDMSTVRGWWEEDTSKTQRFYNKIMGQMGNSPFHCSSWINRDIVLQHLYSPAMWSIFQLQDILGIDENIRNNDPITERINVPADPKHYWRYRMHVTLEDLLEKNEFNQQLKTYISDSGR
jgi:4-alpha-glucanotransferase